MALQHAYDIVSFEKTQNSIMFRLVGFYKKTSVQVQAEKQNRSIPRYEIPVPDGGVFRSLVFFIVSDSSLRYSLSAP